MFQHTYVQANFVSDLESKNFPGYISSSNDPQGQAGGIKGSMSCGVGRSSRIVGRTEAKPAEFPWQVGFRRRTAYSMTNLFCGGTLIDKEWVVSAAHCFQKSTDIRQLRVVLGEFDVNNEDGNEVEIGVDKVEIKVEFTYFFERSISLTVRLSKSYESDLVPIIYSH